MILYFVYVADGPLGHPRRANNAPHALRGERACVCFFWRPRFLFFSHVSF